MEPMENILTEYGISPLPKNTTEGMAYVPFQPNNAPIFAPIQGFEVGTMFPSLDKPFYGRKCEGGKND